MQIKNFKTTTVRTANQGVVTYELLSSSKDERAYNIYNRKNKNKNTEIGPKRKQAVANFNGMLIVLDLNEPHDTVLTSDSEIISVLSFEHRRPLGKRNFFLDDSSLFLMIMCFFLFCFLHLFESDFTRTLI